jgi:hypothetical protein
VIKVTLAKVIEAFGVKGSNQQTGAEVLTGLRAIEKMKLPDYKLKHALTMLHLELEPRVSAWTEARQARFDGAMMPVLGADGKVQQMPDRQGGMQDVMEIPRDKAKEIAAVLTAELKGEVEFPFERIVWPTMIDPKDAEKKERILPDVEDMALTACFIDYDKACA